MRPLLLACLLLAACVGEKPIHYYRVNQPAAPAAAVKANGPILLVARIAAPEALQDNRIRYRAGANEVGAYEYHRWTDRPSLMVRELLIQTLRDSGRYRQVQEASSSAVGDFLLRGRLDEFDEIDEPALHSRVSLRLELVDRKTGLVVWDRHFHREEPIAAKNIKDVVASLERNLQQVIAEASAALAQTSPQR